MTKITNSVVAAAIVTASISGAVSAASSEPIPANQAIKNVVLVHGAFADGSGWRGVYDNLSKRGYRVTIVQNPLTSFEDDVAATKRALERQDGPVILVGHSRSEEHTSELQSRQYLVCSLLLEKKINSKTAQTR